MSRKYPTCTERQLRIIGQWIKPPLHSLVICTLIAFMSCGVSHGATTVIDDFNDGVISTDLWTVVDNGVVLQEAAGVINASAPATSMGYSSSLSSKLSLQGDFDVSYDYTWINGVGSSRTRTQLYVFNESEDMWFSLNFWRGGGSPDGDLRFTLNDVTYIGNHWNPPVSGKLRITRTGQSFQAYYWSGGWFSLGSYNGFTGDAHVFLTAQKRDGGSSPLNVNWDNFSATADNIVGVPLIVKPSSYDYGTLAVNWTKMQTFQIENATEESCTIGSISISGTDTSEFGLQDDTCSGSTLAPHEARSFKVVFTAASLGAKSATIVIPITSQSVDPKSVSLRALVTPICDGDLNHDGRMDMRDWLLFGQRWGATNCAAVPCACDMNADGRCDMRDWLVFGRGWGRTDCPVQ